jgi:hypothetical protein
MVTFEPTANGPFWTTPETPRVAGSSLSSLQAIKRITTKAIMGDRNMERGSLFKPGTI